MLPIRFYCQYLPTASEGLGKVMFSHVSLHPSIRLSVCPHPTWTGYMAVSMPLAFTQEDFLVLITACIRRMGEGNVFSLFTSGGGGGTHIPKCFATLPRMPWGSQGVPCQVQPGGVPWYHGRGGTLAGGVPWLGGTLPGGTQLGQHREYLLHGGRYASCIHAGGLSC